MPTPTLCAVGLIVAAVVSTACGRPLLKTPETAPRGFAQAPLQSLWQMPADLETRDLYWGSGRADRAPSLDVEYTVLRLDESGYSKGYDVVGPDGRRWDIKVGKEAQPEVALSRILWALGYHQPEVYYVTGWRLAGTFEDEGTPARFRLQSDHQTSGEWAWLENPFTKVQALHALVAINILLGNWDFKTSNNRIYRALDGRPPQQRFVVQDLGASLGKPRVFPIPVGTRNDIDDFEDTQLVKKVEGAAVVLDYRGRHGDVLEQMEAADVLWACTLMNRLTDAQLADALRAAGYDEELRRRFAVKIRAKIQEGLALRSVVAATRASR